MTLGGHILEHRTPLGHNLAGFVFAAIIVAAWFYIRGPVTAPQWAVLIFLTFAMVTSFVGRLFLERIRLYETHIEHRSYIGIEKRYEYHDVLSFSHLEGYLDIHFTDERILKVSTTPRDAFALMKIIQDRAGRPIEGYETETFSLKGVL